jgi:hypothetical protein
MDEENDFFPITKVHRDDLAEIGFDTAGLSDLQMANLAIKMGEAYKEHSFWTDLEIIAEFMQIPKKPEKPEGSIGRGD